VFDSADPRRSGRVDAWEPLRRFRVWHDRAVFHFLTSPPGQHRYVCVLDAVTETDAVAVFGCFAPDGPERCSGLPIARYDIPALAATSARRGRCAPKIARNTSHLLA
jgi:hypothetical protein